MKKIKLISLEDNNVRVYKIAESLKEYKNDVEILLLDRKNVNKEKDYQEQIINGIKVKRFFCRKKEDISKYNKIIKNIIYFSWFLNFIKKIKKYLKNTECDYLICQANIGTYAGLHSKKKNTKIIYDMRELYEGRGKKISFFLKKFNSYLIYHCNYIIYLNDKQKSMINKKYHDKLIFVPNYVSLDHFKNIKKTSSNKIRISYIGCPRDYLSLSNLIKASKEFDNVLIFIHGMGDIYDKLKAMEKDYSNLKVTGFYDGIKESEKLYNNTDLLFCGYDTTNINWKNAIAVKYYEAMVTLTPVMVFEESKMGELVKKYKNGFLIKENTIDSFKNTLSLINKKELKKIENNIKNIQYNYVWESVVENLYKVIGK